ncbi:hypothetical protein LTR28_009404 [Elasticomyces elasticus]|nr:hypothetical protein LTR28_009404 [Elasticomyces elasticus]
MTRLYTTLIYYNRYLVSKLGGLVDESNGHQETASNPAESEEEEEEDDEEMEGTGDEMEEERMSGRVWKA